MVSKVGSSGNTTGQLADVSRSAIRSGYSETANNVAGDIGKSTKNNVTLSSLAQQLSERATRTEEEYSSLSRKELGAKAETLLSQITGSVFSATRTIRDAEVPDSSDPERLARAKDATQFVNGNGKNPFAGLSRDQLALITYDDSGAFTTNERRAAWEESADQEYAWRQKVVAKAMADYNSTGKLTGFFSDVLDHYQTLPAIEQAQYPANYADKLQTWIDLDYNYLTDTVEGKGNPQDALSVEQSLNLVQN